MLFINAFINLICFLAGSPSGSGGTQPRGEPSGERVRTPSGGVRTPHAAESVRTPSVASTPDAQAAGLVSRNL